MATNSSPLIFSMFLLLPLFLLSITSSGSHHIREATVEDLQLAFKQNKLTSRQLVKFYLKEIQKLNPSLRGVIEVNPDALDQADKADNERQAKAQGSLIGLHGIPVLLKDNIATKDKMNTTAGSYALLGSIVPQDAGVVAKLRRAGAIILGKASLSEWAHWRSRSSPLGWCARSGYGKNPYNFSAEPCGSSSGSAISTAANMVAVSLGTETDGSILCPSFLNSIVGIKPTVGLTSRAGVIPITPRQDTVGPMCRTVADAAYVLDAIVGLDYNDKATIEALKYIPQGSYKQFLKLDGLKGKRLGILRSEFAFDKESIPAKTYEQHFKTLRQAGAVLIDNVEVKHKDILTSNYEDIAINAEFKLALNAYLTQLVKSPVRSLKDVIAFNNRNPGLEKMKEYGQDHFMEAEPTNGIHEKEREALSNLEIYSKYGFEKLIQNNKLDALVAPFISHYIASGGYPGITVPAGYDIGGIPFGINFAGLKGSEPTLIEIAYSFEQATKVRRPPF
ncbi:hypothetical protein SLA2020_055080 [Shorea laevis]